MEQDRFQETRRSPYSYCPTCFLMPEETLMEPYNPLRLENIALQAYANFIHKCRASVLESRNCESFLNTSSELTLHNVVITKKAQTLEERQFLSSGPHLCLDEEECEFIKVLVRQVPYLFANQLTELIGWPLKCDTQKTKSLLESMVHPAVTRIQDPCDITAVRCHVFCKILPTLRNLQQITIVIEPILYNYKRYVNKTEEDILTSVNNNCNQLKDLRLHFYPLMMTDMNPYDHVELSDMLTQLPVSLKRFTLHGNHASCEITDLGKMACSERYSSLYCLSLSTMDCIIPLQIGFKSLTVLQLEKFDFEASSFLKYVGGQIRKISFCEGYGLNLQDLAAACPSLEVLEIKWCSVFYDVQQPEPYFKSLKKFHYSFSKNIFGIPGWQAVFLTLKHSIHLESIEILTKETCFPVCFERLLGIESLSELIELDVYFFNSQGIWGMLSNEIVEKLLKQCPYICAINGIESISTRNALSKTYPTVKFLCVSQKLKNCLIGGVLVLEDRAKFMCGFYEDESDVED